MAAPTPLPPNCRTQGARAMTLPGPDASPAWNGLAEAEMLPLLLGQRRPAFGGDVTMPHSPLGTPALQGWSQWGARPARSRRACARPRRPRPGRAARGAPATHGLAPCGSGFPRRPRPPAQVRGGRSQDPRRPRPPHAAARGRGSPSAALPARPCSLRLPATLPCQRRGLGSSCACCCTRACFRHRGGGAGSSSVYTPTWRGGGGGFPLRCVSALCSEVCTAGTRAPGRTA